jgi:hypothetical protein
MNIQEKWSTKAAKICPNSPSNTHPHPHPHPHLDCDLPNQNVFNMISYKKLKNNNNIQTNKGI